MRIIFPSISPRYAPKNSSVQQPPAIAFAGNCPATSGDIYPIQSYEEFQKQVLQTKQDCWVLFLNKPLSQEEQTTWLDKISKYPKTPRVFSLLIEPIELKTQQQYDRYTKKQFPSAVFFSTNPPDSKTDSTPQIAKILLTLASR